jgi:hypothetical protein
MPTFFYDRENKSLIAFDEAAISARVLEKCTTTVVVAYGLAQPAETKQRKWHKANKKGKSLQAEIDAHYKGGRVSKVSEEDKAKVEDELIAGMTVAACFEKFGSRLGVSSAWFYLVRSRLKKEGKL